MMQVEAVQPVTKDGKRTLPRDKSMATYYECKLVIFINGHQQPHLILSQSSLLFTVFVLAN
jgi:hypothetical protein